MKICIKNLVSRAAAVMLAVLVLMANTQAGLAQPSYGPNPPPTPTSSQPDSPITTGSGIPLSCRGDRSWDVFIANTLSADEFSEYWKDIFVRYQGNFCLYQDIQNIRKRLTGIRKQLRSAFYACVDTNQMEKAYNRLEAELYFLRKYVNIQNGEVINANLDTLYQEMRDFFVTDRGFYTDEAEFKTVFDQLAAQYENKMEVYKNCKDPGWQQLSDKWNEFREFFSERNPVIKQTAQSLKNHWAKMEKVSLNLDRDFIGGYLGVGINGIPAGKDLKSTFENLGEGFSEIGEAFRENLPSVPTYESFQAARQNNARVTERNMLVVEYLTQYQSLYKESSDQFTKGMVNSLDTLNRIVQDTYQYQNQTISCVKSIKDKQCP